MKRIHLIMLGFLFISFASGQVINIRVGPSFSGLNWERNGRNMGFNNLALGYSIFAGVDYFDHQRYNLSSNLGLIRKGGENSSKSEGGWYLNSYYEEGKAKLDYISLNTKLDLKFGNKNDFTEFISIGPRIDYLYDYSKEYEEFDHLKKISYGLILGCGIKYNISQIVFSLGVDYYFNLAKIADYDEEYSEGSINDYTFAVSLTIGYRL